MQKMTPFDHLNRRFIDLNKVAFSVGQVAENDLKMTFDNLNHHKISSQCLTTTRKVAFLTSPKSHFGLVQRPKRRWNYQASPWVIAFTTSSKSHFGMVKRPKKVQS